MNTLLEEAFQKGLHFSGASWLAKKIFREKRSTKDNQETKGMCFLSLE